MDLSDITPEALSGILSSLSEEDTENIARLASELFSSGEKVEKKGSETDSGFGLDMNTVIKMASVINKLSSQPEDPGCRLLRDLKPMLSSDRQEKVDKALQIMKIMSLMPVIKELNF